MIVSEVAAVTVSYDATLIMMLHRLSRVRMGARVGMRVRGRRNTTNTTTTLTAAAFIVFILLNLFDGDVFIRSVLICVGVRCGVLQMVSAIEI